MRGHSTTIAVKVFIPIVIVLIIPLLITLWMAHELRKLEHLDRVRSFANEVESGIKWIISNKGMWSTNQANGIYTAKCSEASNFYLLDPHNPFPTKSSSYKFLSINSKATDDFESKAIESIKQGKEEVWAISKGEFLYMKAVKVTKDCLACHGKREEVKEPFLSIIDNTCGNSCFGFSEGEVKAAIWVKQELVSPLKIIGFIKWQFLVGQIIIILAVIGLFNIIRKYVTNPIKELSDKAMEMAYGNLDVEFNPYKIAEEEAKDEIVKLEIALDKMKENLKGAIDRLRRRQ